MSEPLTASLLAAREYVMQLEKPEAGFCMLLFWTHRALVLGQLCGANAQDDVNLDAARRLFNMVAAEGADYFELPTEEAMKLYQGMLKLMVMGTEEVRVALKEGPKK